jgi:hypothetical protein
MCSEMHSWSSNSIPLDSDTKLKALPLPVRLLNSCDIEGVMKSFILSATFSLLCMRYGHTLRLCVYLAEVQRMDFSLVMMELA